MANALTATRLLLVIPFALFMSRVDARSALFALIVWVVALATDFLDGPIARRRGTVSALTGAFRGSKLGRYNGVLYFAPPIVDILIRLGALALEPLLTILVWALVLSTLVSMSQRFMVSRLSSAEHLPSRSPEK